MHSTDRSIRRARILGVAVDLADAGRIQQAIRAHLTRRNGLLHVITLNPEYVMTARTSPTFATAIEEAGLITVDGVGVEAVAKLAWPAEPVGRYTGVDLSWFCAEVTAEMGADIFLLGAGPGVADRAADAMRARFPGARIVGTWADGSPREEHDAESLRRIRESGASVVLVAYGAPNQVYWIQRNLPALRDAGVLLTSGIGGALDYISGNVTYAPQLVRRAGMEWLYRLVREPWRWRRQLVLPLFAVRAIPEALKNRLVR